MSDTERAGPARVARGSMVLVAELDETGWPAKGRPTSDARIAEYFIVHASIVGDRCLSDSSALGRALLDCQVGDRVTVDTGFGRRSVWLLGVERSGWAAGLSACGRWPLPAGPRVAVVGARRPTYGKTVAEGLATDLARAGVVVISGLGPGVDTAAHHGALLGEGLTVAVMSSGVDVVYPAAGLADRIVAGGGALVSEFPEGTRSQRSHFSRQCRTMAALADLVVVVEAAEGSYALTTADAALTLGKTVMAVPGSAGCHQLLLDGAGLVENARDVLAELSGLAAGGGATARPNRPEPVDRPCSAYTEEA